MQHRGRKLSIVNESGSQSSGHNRLRPRVDEDNSHIYTYFYRGPHEFSAYPPAHWPNGVLEEIPENETDQQHQQRERREKFRACVVMSGRSLRPADIDNQKVDQHIDTCIGRGLVHPYEWATREQCDSD